MISKTLVRDIPLNPEKNFQKIGALSVNNYKFSIVYSIRARAIKVTLPSCPEVVTELSEVVTELSKIVTVLIDKKVTQEYTQVVAVPKCKKVTKERPYAKKKKTS